jgi:hypothetical protein
MNDDVSCSDDTECLNNSPLLKCFILNISHITSRKLEEHTKLAVQKCHQSAPAEGVLVTLLQDILYNTEW